MTFTVTLTNPRRKTPTHRLTLTDPAAGPRDAALREWFGPGVYWDSHELDGPRVGRVVRQKIRKSHGKDKFVDEPLTKWVKLTVRKS